MLKIPTVSDIQRIVPIFPKLASESLRYACASFSSPNISFPPAIASWYAHFTIFAGTLNATDPDVPALYIDQRYGVSGSAITPVVAERTVSRIRSLSSFSSSSHCAKSDCFITSAVAKNTSVRVAKSFVASSDCLSVYDLVFFVATSYAFLTIVFIISFFDAACDVDQDFNAHNAQLTDAGTNGRFILSDASVLPSDRSVSSNAQRDS